MSGFRALRDVSNNFENELRQWNSEAYSAKIGEKFEDVLSKKLRDMKLFSSKLKLLRAKPLALTPQIQQQPLDNALQEYGDAATWKLIEHVAVKSLTQAHVVKSLITTPNGNLDPDLIERKEAIMASLSQYRQKESQLRRLDGLLKEREAENAALKAEWDSMIQTLQDRQDHRNETQLEGRGPLFLKLNKLVDKLELMRWLIGRLVCARGNYDWLADPQRRLSALALTRAHNTVEMFTQDSAVMD